MPPPLLLSRRFAPLFWREFFAAFNDNFLNTALVFLILFHSGAVDAEVLVTLAGTCEAQHRQSGDEHFEEFQPWCQSGLAVLPHQPLFCS
jgi:hypothetical protein